MNAHSHSEFGTMLSADDTLADAIKWAEELQKAEFRGLGDTRDAARHRVSAKTGVPESYLKRLRHKTREMQDVPASIYVRLCIAYARICQATERKAEHVRAIRLAIKENDEAVESHSGIGR